MIDYNANHQWSPLCRKKPKRSLSSWGAPFLYSKTIVILAILALAALGGGIFLETQSKKNVQRVTIATEVPDPYFQVEMLVSTYNLPAVQGAYIISDNLRQIGIGTDITVIGWGRPFGSPNSLGKTMAEDSTGRIFRERFDLALWPRAPDILEEWSLVDYYHSTSDMNEEYPIDLSTLDGLLNAMQNATDLLERRPLLLQALGQILWDIQAVTCIYDTYDPFALDDDIRNFDPDRWALGFPNLPEMYFASSNQTAFVYAGQHQSFSLNPAYSHDHSIFPRSSPYLPANYLSNLVFSRTYEQDRNLTLRPILAADFPVAIRSYNLVPATGIAPDSPYFGKERTPWGPNPTINSSQYNSQVEADDNSMFLLRLREEIPWQPGYGYTPEMKLNVTADDLVWTLSYLLNDTVGIFHPDTWCELFGANFSNAIEKINTTTVKINLRGPLGDGKVANWFEALAIPPLPRHILDPTFNATPYGGSEGRTPDGTLIRPYQSQEIYRYNTGAGTNPVVSCGPYYVEGVDTKEETIDPAVQSRIKLKKFSDWGGRGAKSLWNAPQFLRNNIESYVYEVYSQWEEVRAAFLYHGLLDGLDWEWHSADDLPAWVNNQNIQFSQISAPSQQVLVFNVLHPDLSELYVRLAISHAIPRQKIVDVVHGGNGTPNELVGVTHQLGDYPDEEEWDVISPSSSVNLTSLALGGHITHDLDKAWALMELAGYNMDAFRAYYGEKPPEQTKTNGIALPYYSVILAIVALSTICFGRKLRKGDKK